MTENGPSEMTEAELAQKILASANADNFVGTVLCNECGANLEFNMERFFEYVLERKYGLTVTELETRIGSESE